MGDLACLLDCIPQLAKRLLAAPFRKASFPNWSPLGRRLKNVDFRVIPV